MTAGLLGNIVEHYDKALFGLLAPFIGALFFEATDPITALIQAFGILYFGFLVRPLGSLVCGIAADRWGRKTALTYSLIGMSAATLAMGFLPLYRDVGIWSTLGLALTRLLQSFFAAGETNAASIFILEHSTNKMKPFICSLLEASTVVGIMIASAGMALISCFGDLPRDWRYLLWIGGAIGFLGVLLRGLATESKDFAASEQKHSFFEFLHHVFTDFRAIIAISVNAGFSCVVYVMAITFMNAYLTLISPMKVEILTSMNTFLLGLDMVLLPLFGYLATKIAKEKVMMTAAGLIAVLALPLFHILDEASIEMVVGIRILLVILGVCFAAPFRLWAQELIPVERRCTTINLGCALGHLFIEAPAVMISLWLYKSTGWVFAPGIYLGFSALLACYFLTPKKITEKVTETEKLFSN